MRRTRRNLLNIGPGGAGPIGLTKRNEAMRRKSFWLLAILCLALPTQAAGARYAYKDLGTLGGQLSEAYGINDAGVVVGAANTQSGETHAFLWTLGSPMRDLGSLSPSTGGNSWANAINEFVVGTSYAPIGLYGTDHAFRWSATRGMEDLGALEYPDNASFANGVNKLGAVVGYSYVSGLYTTRSFLWQKRIMTNLGTFGGTASSARGINDKGQIAGDFYDSAAYKTRGFLREISGAWQDLENLGGITTMPMGLNNNGHVVGWSYDNNNNNRAFLWTPSPNNSD